MKRPEGARSASTPPRPTSAARAASPARPAATAPSRPPAAASHPAAAAVERPARAPRPSRDPTPSPSAHGTRDELEARLAADGARARRREERREIRRFTRRARRRRAGWFTAAGVLVALLLLVVTAVYSPLLALRTITVDGTNRLSAAALEKALAPNLGTPLALLDDARITRELSRFRLIRSYVTELQPPGTLVVHISERTPIGVVQGADDFQLVDPAGVVVDRSAKRPDGVPLIQLGSAPLRGPGFGSMAQVLLALPVPLRAQVDTVAALTHDDVTLTLRGSGQRVVWGSADRSDLKAQVLARLIALHGQGGSGTYTVSAPEFAVFNPGEPSAVGGTDAASAVPSPTTGPVPTSTASPGADQGGVQR